jgi:hypothetical protein
MQIHTEEYRGFDINVHTDEMPMDPRKEFDQLGKIVWVSNDRHILGDEQADDLDEYMWELAVEVVPGLREMFYFLFGDEDEEEDRERAAKIISPLIAKHYIILPLHYYDHSGISITDQVFSYSYDSGIEGVIYVSRKQAIEYGKDGYEEKIIELLKGEVEEYDHYISGRVYGYTIEPKDTNKGIECDDSCWGFYGDYYMMAEARSAIDHAIKAYREEVITAKRERKQTERFLRTHWAD